MPSFAGIDSKPEKLLATARQLIGKNCLLFEKSGNFKRANVQISLTLLPLFVVVRL